MVKCEYNQDCASSKKYRDQLTQLNLQGKYQEKMGLWEDYTKKCSDNYENCPDRKKFMEAEK